MIVLYYLINSIFASYQETDFKIEMTKVMDQKSYKSSKGRSSIVSDETSREILHEGGESSIL